MIPQRLRRNDGFALPLALFLIGILTVMLSAAFARTAGDRRIAENTGGTQDALAIAQGGLNQYLDTKKTRPYDGDSTRIYLVHGYADIVVRLVQRPADTSANRTYVVRSTGNFLDPARLGAEPGARRTVAQFATWQSASMDVRAAFVAANGLSRTGQYVELRGADACTGTSILAARVPAGEAPSSTTSWMLTGQSPYVYADSDGPSLANLTDIDWASTVSNGGLVPHYDRIMLSDFSYSIQRVTGNATLGQAGASVTGTGLLIVTGDLRTIGTNVQWYGVVLVGGRITFDATSSYFDGAVVSGLNEQLGQNVPIGGIGANYADIDYNSCLVTQALSPLHGLVKRPGWIDAWTSY